MRTTTLWIGLAALILGLGLTPSSLGQVPAKRFITRDGQRPTGLFAPGVMVGKTLYVAGKGDYRPDEDFPEKVRNCLNEVRKTLRMAGLDMEHVVKSFVYLEEPEKFPEFNQYYAEFFPNNPPARTTLGVAEVPGESRIEITCIAYADLSERRTIGEPPAGFPFSPGVLAGETLYVSGKGDHLPDGSHPETFEEQVRQTMRNVETTLKDAGLDFRHVVMSHVFVDDPANLEVAQEVYGEFFEAGDEPACATLLVDWIPGDSHVEVTCFATTDLDSRQVVRPEGTKDRPDVASVAASPAVWAGNILYLSGLAGFESDGSLAEDLDEQCHQLARNQIGVLEAAGLSLEDIVCGFVYLRDIADYQPMNAIYREYFSKGPGVRTCLMPHADLDRHGIHVRASFIAARTE